MTVRQLLLFGSSMLVCSLFGPGREASAQPQSPIVRIAELEIDPDQLESYKAALKQEIETSIRVEAGVLTLYAVSIKDPVSGAPSNSPKGCKCTGGRPLRQWP
jgi:4-carboxymuconolactone decarboxylase